MVDKTTITKRNKLNLVAPGNLANSKSIKPEIINKPLKTKAERLIKIPKASIAPLELYSESE